MKKIFLIVFSMLLSLSFVNVIEAANFKCKIGKYSVEYNSSGKVVAVYGNNGKKISYDGSASSAISPKTKDECPHSSEYRVNIDNVQSGKKSLSITSAKKTAKEKSNSATNCTGLISKEACESGKTANGNYSCVWNDKYDFCSPTGLAYLSCGKGNEDAHDIPVIIPRLTSYGITILKTVTPVILIIMGMFQMVKAITSQNEDEIKKTTSALIKKLLAAAMVFFIISIVQFIIKQTADSTEEGSASQCLSCFVNNDCNGSMYYTDGYGKCYYLSSKGNGKTCNTDIGGA